MSAEGRGVFPGGRTRVKIVAGRGKGSGNKSPFGEFADRQLVEVPLVVVGPPQIDGIQMSSTQVQLTVNGLLAGHNYIEQSSRDLGAGIWTNALTFSPTQSSASLTNSLSAAPSQFWRILAP